MANKRKNHIEKIGDDNKAEIDALIQRGLRSMERDSKRGFQKKVRDISKIYLEYSPQDIAEALFTSNLWLPNISAQIKHQFLISIFASQKPRDFTASKKIKTYKEFKEFLQRIYTLCPSFHTLEDYFPETDWGDIKFHYREKNYKIFYGNELSNIYEYLILFQMLYLPFDVQYFGHANRLPSGELKNCLQLQNDIISGISKQPSSNSMINLMPGHVEIPPKNFWESCVKFYRSYNPAFHFDETYLKNYSISLGQWPKKYLSWEDFNSMTHNGKAVPAFFVSYKDSYLPILPRRYSSILFDKWTKIFEDNHDKVVHGRMPYSMHIGIELYKYLRERINNKSLFDAVCAITDKEQPHEIFFASAFISKDRLILLYVCNPSGSSKDIQNEIIKLAPKLRRALKLFSQSPTRLGLEAQKKIVEFDTKQGKASLKPTIFVLIPQVSTTLSHILVPKKFPASMFMDQFLGIIDELENEEMLASFLEYLEEYGESIRSFLSGPLDALGSFKSNYGVLVPGAREYSFVSLDPHWGSKMRYQSLSEFWKEFPDVDFIGHPRSWRIERPSENYICLVARALFRYVFHCRIGSVDIFINSPVDQMSYDQGLVANQLMECLIDAISENSIIVNKHKWFQSSKQLRVFFCPESLASNEDRFNYLKHLDAIDGYWKSDCGIRKQGIVGVRIVFNEENLLVAFTSIKDRSLEVDLLIEVLTQINTITSDNKIGQIVKALDKQKACMPRFKMFLMHKQASFPEFVDCYEPEPVHFLRAKKKIAELAKKNDFAEGFYELETAKIKLNVLREALIAEVNTEVGKYDFQNAVPYLLTRIDALIDEYKRTTATIQHSLEHDVSYDRKESYAESHNKYVTMQRNYRYLIEKFVQIEPKGALSLDEDRFRYLIALIDWLHVFYIASDSLHYGLHPVGLRVDRDYLVEVEYEENIGNQEKELMKEDAGIRLGLKGIPTDSVNSSRETEDFLDALDKAFKQDLGFTFRSMINVLQVMSFWGEFKEGADISPYYSASLKEIEEVCLREVQGIQAQEIEPILTFLTLRSSEVVQIIGQSLGEKEICSDLPVWEHRKRFARYNLRPIILINNKYFWGPYSAMNSGLIWSGHISIGSLPTDLGAPTLESELSREKKLIEDKLVDKAYEIVGRFTEFRRMNLYLRKLKMAENAPDDLGDYDILAYCQDKNVVLSIECKDILQVFCLKDLKRLREKIFGTDLENQGYFGQINKRAKYLDQHLSEISTALKWPIDPNNMPKICTIYLTRKNFWWTKFPPYKVEATFLQINELADFIKNYK